MIPCGDSLEFRGAIGDQAGKDIQPSGRAFRVRHRRNLGRKRQRFLQLDDIEASALENRPALEIDFMHGKAGQLVGNTRFRPRKEG